MDPQEILLVTAASGNHDEGTGQTVNLISSALILADKVVQLSLTIDTKICSLMEYFEKTYKKYNNFILLYRFLY